MESYLTTLFQNRTGRSWALTEATAQISVGFAVSWAATVAVMPIFGFYPGAGAALQIVLIYTALSFARQYLIRRLFQKMERS
jgi:hypothetical protein